MEAAPFPKDEGQTLEELGEEPDLWVPWPDGSLDPKFVGVMAVFSPHKSSGCLVCICAACGW